MLHPHTTSRRRHLAWLSSTSLAAALVIAGAAAITLSPTAAFADNECAPAGVDPSVNGDAPDSYACSTASSTGITYTSDGPLTLNFAGSANVGSNGINLVASADSPITIDIATTGAVGTASVSTNVERVDAVRWADLVIEAEGPSTLTIENDGDLRGAVDLSGLSGGSTLEIGATATWGTVGLSRFSTGDDTISIAEGGMMMTSPGRYVSVVPAGGIATTLDFLGGENVMDNAGTIFLGESRAVGRSGNTSVPKESITTFVNLDQFNNSGLIVFGRHASDTGISDFVSDDTLAIPGGAFTGLAGSTLMMDASMSIGGQTDCADRVADCLDLSGGETAGVTSIILRDTFLGDRGGASPVMLVDVAGGTSAQGHFVLDPASDGYDARFGGVINKGLLLFALRYDPEAERHALVAAPSGAALQFASAVQSAQHIWRSASGSWFDRQADLRGQLGGRETDGGGWVRFTWDTAERDLPQTSDAGGATFSFDNSFSQDGYAATLGFDLVGASGESQGYVVGVMAGYAHTELEYDASPNRARFDGFLGGAYASYLSGPFFVDGMFSAAGLVMHNHIPSLNLFPAESELDTDVRVLGGQLETGWRFDVADGLFVEPTASLSYSRTTFEDVVAPSSDVARPGNTLEYDDATSLRGALGARLGVDVDHGPVLAQYSLLARAGNEFDGEAGVTLQSTGQGVLMSDDFSGAFTEVALGVSLFSPGGALSAFGKVHAAHAQDHESLGATAGFRFRW